MSLFCLHAGEESVLRAAQDAAQHTAAAVYAVAGRCAGDILHGGLSTPLV